MKGFSSVILAVFLLAGCATEADPAPEPKAEESRWNCVSDETAFGEVRALCRTVGDYLEGELVVMRFWVGCSIENPSDTGYAISRFEGVLPGGRSAEFLRKIDVLIDGGPKIEAEWSGYEEYVLRGELAGEGADRDEPHQILDSTETFTIRAIVEPRRNTTTSVFSWGNWNEPTAYLEEIGCTW